MTHHWLTALVNDTLREQYDALSLDPCQDCGAPTRHPSGLCSGCREGEGRDFNRRRNP